MAEFDTSKFVKDIPEDNLLLGVLLPGLELGTIAEAWFAATDKAVKDGLISKEAGETISAQAGQYTKEFNTARSEANGERSEATA